MTTILNAQVFRENLNTRFTINTPQEKYNAELVQVNESRAGDDSTSSMLEQFSLLFRISDLQVPVLPQATYTFEHPRVGDASIFIVPVEKNKEGVYYEAIFNRIIETRNNDAESVAQSSSQQ